MKNKISKLQLILTVLFVSSFLISNIITTKQVLLPFNIVMTAAVFIFPVVYILSDVFSEIYGYKWSRFTCYLAFAMNLFMVVIFYIAIKAPAASYWENQKAFEIVLGNTPKIFFASLLAFVVGDFANDNVFRYLKKEHKDDHVGFGFRAIISSLCGELVDSLIFIPIAFFGQVPEFELVKMIFAQVLIKTSYEIIILPLTSMIVKKVSKHERSEKYGKTSENYRQEII